MDELAPHELIGTRLGQYRLEGLIGQTGKSLVFRAKHLVLDRKDALKVLKPNQGKEREEQFLKEGRRLAVLEEHDNITNVYAAGEDQGLHYIAMKLVEGENLKDLVDAGRRFSLREILDIMTDISTAVTYAYSRGLEHNDIKLANIKIREKGPKRIYLVDFGGRLTEEDSDSETTSKAPPKEDNVAMGLIAEQLFDNRNSEVKIPGQLDNIFKNAERGIYRNPEDLAKAIKGYKRRVTRRKFLKVSGFASGLLTASLGVGVLGKKYSNYRSSIDYIQDKIAETEDSPENLESLLKKLNFRLFDQKIRELVEEGMIPRGKFPYAVSDEGKEWILTNSTSWTSGFWPGLLWKSFETTQDSKFKDWAVEWLNDMNFSIQDHISINTIRFLYSHALGYEITGEQRLKEIALRASDLMAKRFNENGGFIQTGGGITSSDEQKIYIDAMTTGLPLLAWNYSQTGNSNLEHIITSHCNATMKYNINKDGSIIQVMKFNPNTGESLGGDVSQGYKGESCLSRGQARAIEGFAIAYKTIGDEKYLETAERCADYFIRNLPEDKVPFYDFKDPNKGIPKDSSAASTATSGLLDLFQITNNPRYRITALQILKSLSADYLTREKEYQGFLLHGCANINRGANLDCALIYGDYPFFEALSKISFQKVLTPTSSYQSSHEYD